jgi:hypothetical protein
MGFCSLVISLVWSNLTSLQAHVILATKRFIPGGHGEINTRQAEILDNAHRMVMDQPGVGDVNQSLAQCMQKNVHTVASNDLLEILSSSGPIDVSRVRYCMDKRGQWSDEMLQKIETFMITVVRDIISKAAMT